MEEIIGIAEERESSSAQIRTLFNEQRRTIIAECCEKVSHHEFQAARAEQERKILQEELWRQQQDFREVHQQDLTAGTRNFCKLLWVSCEVLFLHGYAWIH